VFNESTAPGSPWNTLPKEHGEALEHIAFKVTNINEGLLKQPDKHERASNG